MPIGSDFDDFLKKERIYEGCTAQALKRVLAWQITEAMTAEGYDVRALAEPGETEPHAVFIRGRGMKVDVLRAQVWQVSDRWIAARRR